MNIRILRRVSVLSRSLRQAASHAGLARSGTAHHALEDTRLTLETFRHFVGRLSLRRPLEDGPAVEAVVREVASGS